MLLSHRNAYTFLWSLAVTTDMGMTPLTLRTAACSSLHNITASEENGGKTPPTQGSTQSGPNRLYWERSIRVQTGWGDGCAGMFPKMCECPNYVPISVNGEVQPHKPPAPCIIRWPQRTSTSLLEASEKDVKEIPMSKSCEVWCLYWTLLWGRLELPQHMKNKCC